MSFNIQDAINKAFFNSQDRSIQEFILIYLKEKGYRTKTIENYFGKEKVTEVMCYSTVKNLDKIKKPSGGLAKTLRWWDIGISTAVFYEALLKAFFAQGQLYRLKKIIEQVAEKTGKDPISILKTEYHFNEKEIAVLEKFF